MSRDKPFKFVRAFGPRSSSDESEYSNIESNDSDYSNSESGHSNEEEDSNTMRSDDAPRKDNIKIPKKKTKKKFSKSTIRKKTMPNESEEDSDDSDVIDANNLDKGVDKTNAKNNDSKPLFIRPIYMHKLYIGNTCAAEKEGLLNKLGIGTIISLSDNKPSIKTNDLYIYHYGNLAIDTDKSISTDGFILMIKIINKSLSNGNPVLIQCNDGLVNSIILVLFYLSTIDNGLSIIQKYDWLKRKVPETKLEKDPDVFFKIQANLNRIFTVFNDEIRFGEYCKTILGNV